VRGKETRVYGSHTRLCGKECVWKRCHMVCRGAAAVEPLPPITAAAPYRDHCGSMRIIGGLKM